MFRNDEKKKNIISLVLRIIVSAYIGFMGVMLICKYPDDNNAWYLGIGVFLTVMAVAFVVFGFWYYFRTRAVVSKDGTEQN